MKYHVVALALFALPSALAATHTGHQKASPSSSASLPVVNTFTNKHHTTVDSSAAASSSSSPSPSPKVTKEAVFTAASVLWTVTQAGSVDAVDGKTLLPGGAPINIAGAPLSVKSGDVYVNGKRLHFTKVSAAAMPSSSNSPMGGGAASSSGAAGGSASSSGMAASASSSTSTGGAAMRTAGVGAMVGGAVLALGALGL